MSSGAAGPGAAPEASGGPLEDLIAECAERLDREGVAALAAMCAAHPADAAALRQAIEPLLEFGVVGPTASADTAAVGRLGEFELVREIGRGGMGVVYEARQPSLGRTVALKLLPTAWVQDARQVSRFQNEARAAANLDHPHIVPVFMFGEDRGTHYYAMQLICGTSVRRLLATMRGSGPADAGTAAVLAGLLPPAIRSGPDARNAIGFAAWPRRAAELIRQAAAALAKAHSLGILHRDIKPGNLLVDASGHLWVTDFGLAHFVREASDLTRSGEFVGTVAYSSPEQLGCGGVVDGRSDVYSLGATLYEMVCLHAPFAADDPARLVHRILHDEPRPLRGVDASIPRDLETIVHKAIAKDQAGRYQTAAALAVDLEAFVAGRPIAARPVTRAQRGARWCRRNPVLAAALGGILTLTLLAGGTSYAALRIVEERDRALSAEQRLTQVSARRQIETTRRTIEVRRHEATLGSRSRSLEMLRQIVPEVDTAAISPADREDLLCQLRSDAFSVLDLWDATVEPLSSDTTARPLAFDQDCNHCAIAGDGALLVTDRSGRELAKLSPLGKDSEVEFGPNGDWIAVASDDSVRLWEWRTGRTMVHPAWSVNGNNCWSQDGREVFTMRLEPLRIEAWELRTGKSRVVCSPAPPPNPPKNPWGLAVSADGRCFAACFVVLPELWIFEAGQTTLPRRIPLPFQSSCSAFEPDGEHLLVGGRPGWLRLHLPSGVTVGAAAGIQHVGEATLKLITGAGGALLATRDLNRQVDLWNRRGARLLTIENSTDTRQLDFTADGQHLGWQALHDAKGAPAGAVHWRLHAPVGLREFAIETQQSQAPQVAFHPSLPLLAVLVADAIEFLDSRTGANLGRLAWPWVYSLKFLHDGSLFVCQRGPVGGCAVIAIVAEQQHAVRIGKPHRLEGPGKIRRASSDGKLIGTWDGTRIRVLSREGAEIARLETGLSATNVNLTLLSGGKFVALSTFRGAEGMVWNLETGQVELRIPVFQRGVEFVVSPDGRLLAALRNNEHWLFEVGTWKRLAVIPRHRIEPSIGDAAFSPDATLLVVTTTRSGIQILDTATFRPLAELRMPGDDSATELCFSPDGMTLAIPSRTGQRIYVWDLRAARAALRELGLDWSAAPIPPMPPHTPLRLVFD